MFSFAVLNSTIIGNPCPSSDSAILVNYRIGDHCSIAYSDIGHATRAIGRHLG
jgi:hypothetical protein